MLRTTWFSLLFRLSISTKLLAAVLLCLVATARAEVPDTNKLHMTEWAKNGMTKDPVALAFDNQGRLYVAETARRASVDIDVRAHRTWLLDDLASEDFETMRSFFRRQMATTLSDTNKSWLEDRNGDGIHDYHDLKEVTDRIRLIEDTDDDGIADKSTLYADGFNEEFTGVAAGVMSYEGDVLFTIYPDLWRLRDLDGDGTADGRVSMFRGFGVHAAFDGHDLHGLTVGPEGKIYFSCGDNGFSVVTKEGRRLHYPNTGGVLRMDSDGSNLEVYAYGLRNVQEFDFDQYGNMFGVDNDGDLEDERERAVYIAEGSDSGWRLNWQFRAEGWKEHNGGMTYNPWTAEGMWKPQHSDQPAYITPPMQNYSVGPGGFKFNPGTALNDEYRDFFFCIQFPVKKVTAFRTQSHGAGFEMVDEHVFNGGLMVSSLNFGPDGGAYLADWIGKWQPNNEGIIYRVDDPEMRGSDLRKEVKHYLNNGIADRDDVELANLLGHQDRRVRQLAQFELVRRRRSARLLGVAGSSSAKQLARVHAMWGLIQLQDAAFVSAHCEELPWASADPHIRQQCSRVAGDLRVKESVEQLTRQLEDTEPLVRSHAAMALGKIGSADAVPALFELLRRNADLDPFIRHAGVTGLAGCANPATLAARSIDESAAVRMGAVLALRRKESPAISQFLRDKDVRVLREAVRGIHDDFSIGLGMDDLAAMLESPALPLDEPILRRIVSANFRIGSPKTAGRLAYFIRTWKQDGQFADTIRLEALECLARLDQSPLVDRVEGRIRQREGQQPGLGKKLLARNVEAILKGASATVSAATLKHANELGIRIQPMQLRRWVRTDSVSETARIEAIGLLHRDNDEQIDSLIEQVLAGSQGETVSLLWRRAFEILLERSPGDALKKIRWNGSTQQQQFFVSQLPKFKLQSTNNRINELVNDQLTATRFDSLTLDVLNAARLNAANVDKLELYEKKVREQKYGEFSLALEGGDARRGEHIYRTHVSAQCIRCHNAGGKGKQAGPELTEVGRNKREYLLEALVDPSATIAKGFESVAILKDNGMMITGTVVSENDDAIVIGSPDGKSVSVRKNEIDDRSNATQSAMPKMTEVLSSAEIRDVVEYLSTLK